MLDKTTNKHGFSESLSGGIDYRLYDERARSLRSAAAWGFLQNLFTQKKTSSTNKPGLVQRMESAFLNIRCKLQPCPQI